MFAKESFVNRVKKGSLATKVAIINILPLPFTTRLVMKGDAVSRSIPPWWPVWCSDSLSLVQSSHVI